MRNKIDDLHKKLSVYLVTNFKNIHLGKISTANVISNKKGNPRLEASGRLASSPANLKEIVKRRINVLSFYKFNQTIKIMIMAKKYKSNIKDVNEYMTSKTCHNCQNVDNELGSKKIYKCCKLGTAYFG